MMHKLAITAALATASLVGIAAPVSAQTYGGITLSFGSGGYGYDGDVYDGGSYYGYNDPWAGGNDYYSDFGYASRAAPAAMAHSYGGYGGGPFYGDQFRGNGGYGGSYGSYGGRSDGYRQSWGGNGVGYYQGGYGYDNRHDRQERRDDRRHERRERYQRYGGHGY